MYHTARFDLRVAANGDMPKNEFQLFDNGEPVDLTGATIEWSVRLEQGAAGDAPIEISSADETGDRVELIDAEAGHFRLIVAAATWDDLSLGVGDDPVKFVQDCRITHADGTIGVPWRGALTMDIGVTR